MATSTGPVLAVGGVALANTLLLSRNKPDDPFRAGARIVVGTGIAAALLGLLEQASPELSRALAHLALVAVIFVPVDGQPSIASNLVRIVEG